MFCHRLYGLCRLVVPVSRVGGRRGRWRTHKMTGSIAEEPHWNTGTVRRLCHHGDVAELFDRESVRRFLRQLMEEHSGLTHALQRVDLRESDRTELMRRHTQLLPVASICGRIEQAQRDHEDICSLQASSGSKDEQLTQLLKEEEEDISGKISALRNDLVRALVPPEPLDSSDVLLEVVSGRTTGGDICQQFTREMLDMYEGFASFKNWDFDVCNYASAEHGGLHHAAVRIAGDDVYRHLKHEGGTHRVQRIPEVGLSSRMQRIHTGTMMVIVLPQPVEVDVHIDPKDLRIDTFRSQGAGGQSVNTTDSAVRIVHLPTGVSAECQQTRSQLKNRVTAMSVLKARLYQSMMGKETEQRHSARKQQVGSRAQSERIRSYNFSQDRVTDHRSGYVARDIKRFMRGGEALDNLIADMLEHTEWEALLETVENSSTWTQLESSPSAQRLTPQRPAKWT